MLTWSLRGTVQHLANIAYGYDQRAEKAADEWRSGHYADSAFYPGLGKLPGPLQLLILREREEAELLIEEGQDPREFDKAGMCDCLFWQQYQLPCRHLFQVNNLTGQMIREEYWDAVSFFSNYTCSILTNLVSPPLRGLGLRSVRRL